MGQLRNSCPQWMRNEKQGILKRDNRMEKKKAHRIQSSGLYREAPLV